MTTDQPDGGAFGVDGDDSLFRFGDAEQRLRSITHSLLLLAGAFALAAVLAELGRTLLEQIGLTTETAPVVFQIVPTMLHFTGFLLAAIWYIDWQNARSLIGLRWPTRTDFVWVVAGSLLLVIALLVFDTILAQFGLEPAENVAIEAGREHPQVFLYFIPLVLFFNAPAEELLFRGLIQGLFRRAYGVIPAIVLAAIIFGLVHYVALVGTGSRLVYVSIALISGLILGALYEYTGNLLVPTAVHACWNVLVYLTVYLETTGGL